MIIPSKELKNCEICVPWMDDGEKVLNFRSPFFNSNGLCVSTNKLVKDRLAPDGASLKGIIVVNDEDHKRILARLKTNEVAPLETESERQSRDFDGDCIGVDLAISQVDFVVRNHSESTAFLQLSILSQSHHKQLQKWSLLIVFGSFGCISSRIFTLFLAKRSPGRGRLRHRTETYVKYAKYTGKTSANA